jgi:hypothetical protein
MSRARHPRQLDSGWEDFKEDDSFAPAPAGVPDFPATANAGLLSLAKNAPYHGTSPYWRVGLFTGKGIVDVNGRFTYHHAAPLPTSG